ncbi:hypothetical protein WS93_08840 [Burkholderia cepacia]|nr:hypothetical protein WS93_08840 [Burkholderia cepacia]
MLITSSLLPEPEVGPEVDTSTFISISSAFAMFENGATSTLCTFCTRFSRHCTLPAVTLFFVSPPI